CNHGKQKYNRQPGEQNIQCNLIRGLMPFSAFNQRDHAINKSFSRIGRDSYFDFIRENTCTAGDSGSVSTAFTNHWSRLPCDGRFVDRSDSLDYFPVTWNHLSSRDMHHISATQLRAWD